MGRHNMRNRSSAGRGSRTATTLAGYSSSSLVTQVEPSCPGHTSIGLIRTAMRYEHPATNTSGEPTRDHEELIEDDSDSDYRGGKRRKHHVFNLERPTNVYE